MATIDVSILSKKALNKFNKFSPIKRPESQTKFYAESHDWQKSVL